MTVLRDGLVTNQPADWNVVGQCGSSAIGKKLGFSVPLTNPEYQQLSGNTVILKLGNYSVAEVLPSLSSSKSPTQTPTAQPTETPTFSPTTLSPTSSNPTLYPTTKNPTSYPTTKNPTTRYPTFSPTSRSPTKTPSTVSPSLNPTALSSTKSPLTAPTTQTPTPSQLSTFKPTDSPTQLTTASPIARDSAQEITKYTSIPETVVESIKPAAAENSTRTFLQKLIEDKNRIQKFTGESLAILSSNLATVSILKSTQNSTSAASMNNKTHNEFLAFELRQLIDSNGNRILNLKDHPWKITGPEDSTRDGVKMQKYVASGVFNITSKIGAYLAQTTVDMIIELFSETGTVRYGKSLIRVYPGSVKFSYKISKWPFQFKTDRLYLAILSIASGNGGVFSEGSRLKVGDGFIETPFFAQADGADVPIKVYFEKNSTNQASVLFEFPAFDSNLFYDPIASLSSNPYASEATIESTWFSGMNVIYVSCGAAAFVLGAVTLAFVLHRRKRQLKPAFNSTGLLTPQKGTQKLKSVPL